MTAQNADTVRDWPGDLRELVEAKRALVTSKAKADPYFDGYDDALCWLLDSLDAIEHFDGRDDA
jgi:hypothetical protein